MANHINTRKLSGTWTVRAAGAVIAESDRAIELTEGTYPPVIYFPRDHIAMAFLEPSAKTTHCPHKGDASYFSIEAKSGPIPDAAWSYQTPLDGVSAIAGHLAFHEELVTIEEL